MKPYFILIASCLHLFLAIPATAQEEYELSYLLMRRHDKKILAAQQDRQPRTPASTMKLVTAAAALERLGAEHRYLTTLHSVAAVKRGRLRGDLYLKGSADPELSQDDLAELAHQLHALGLRHVKGDLVIDEGPYADPPYGQGWAWDDTGELYSPEITGLAVDGGAVSITPGVALANTRQEEAPESSLQLVPGRDGALIRGTAARKLVPPYSSLRTGELLKAHLARRGITLQGQIRPGTAQGEPLVTHHSRPLRELLEQALATSDNLAMELIFRSAGEEIPKVLIGEALRRADGSGLSRYNLLSAQQLVSVLLAHPELSALVPGPGEGTLGKRFLEPSWEGKIRAKTGTLGNVSALSGYLLPGQEQECVFAILINGHLGSTAERKAIEDRLVEQWLLQLEHGDFIDGCEKPSES